MTIHIVTGPPAAGKSTFIRAHAKPGDIRIDLDHIANTLAGAEADNHEHAAHILTVAKAARQAAIDAAMKQDATVWIIYTKPTTKQLGEYQALGAIIHDIDPGKDIVMKRCKAERPKGSLIAAAKWYDNKPKAKKTRQQRGYDAKHEKTRARLLRTHKDGTPCWWCGKPMYRNKNKNHDHLPLCADHENAHGARTGTQATRLLHYTCNSSRKDGKNDHKRPALNHTQTQPTPTPRNDAAGFIW